MFDDMDDGARVGVWVVIGLIGMLLFGLIGGLGIRQMNHGKAAQAALVAAPVAAADDTLVDGPLTGELAGTVFFALGQAALPAGADVELAKAVHALEASPNAKLVLSGFHDASGDPTKNAELAKDRAKAVRAAIQTAGVNPTRIALRKPESTTGDGSAQEARRVELRIVD